MKTNSPASLAGRGRHDRRRVHRRRLLVELELELRARASGSSSSSAALTASAPGITPTTITIGSHQPLTGPAAPGYSEIAPASAAYFAYVNAHGGVYGRKIVYKYLNDAYNPTTTASVVRQLVLQDNVYADLRRPRHAHPPGRGELPQRAEGPGRVRRVRLRLLERPDDGPGDVRLADRLHPRREDPRPVREAKHFAGKKVGYFYQDDEFGMDGVKGLD